MRERKVTQSRVGKALGIQQAAVSQLLSGKANLSLPQLLKICELLQVSAFELLHRAEMSTTEKLEHPEFASQVLYRSWRHLLVYVTCIQKKTLSQLETEILPASEVGAVLKDLMDVGLIEKQGGCYRQRDVNRALGGDPNDATERHAEVLSQCLEVWVRNRRAKRDGYFKTRFNYFQLDYFTDDQLGEIDAMLWKVYDRVNEIRAKNLSTGYLNTRPQRLWQLHFSLLTPNETK
jgi:predicted transcriptional regulator